MEIKPGNGIGDIKFGSTEKEIIRILGEPKYVKEAEYVKNSGDFSRELFYEKDLSFTLDSEDNYRLTCITVRNAGHKLFVRVHRAPHLLCSRALEVRQVRLRTRRRAPAAPCKRVTTGETPAIWHFTPVNSYNYLAGI